MKLALALLLLPLAFSQTPTDPADLLAQAKALLPPLQGRVTTKGRQQAVALLREALTEWDKSPGNSSPAYAEALDPAQGGLQDLQLRRGCGYGLDESAAEAVLKWKFQPGKKGEQPISTRVTVEVNFRLL